MMKTTEKDQYASLKESLTEDQKKAFDKAIDWAEAIARHCCDVINGDLIDEDVNFWFVICGYAGVGKSYLTQQLIPALKSILGKRVGACAPTHKAVAVLDDFCGSEVSVIGTIHQFLHLKPSEPDENGDRHLEQTWSKHPHYQEFNLMIVDESSMIGEEIVSFIPRGTPTIFLGDIAQLPPVEDDSEISPLLQSPDVLLTEVVRYKGAIATHVTKIRQNLEKKTPPKFSTKGNLFKYLEREEWEQEAFNEFLKASGNPNNVKMLAWSNKEVESLNKKIRNQLYRDFGDDLFFEGEQVIAKEPLTVWSPDRGVTVLLRTCGEALIHKASLKKQELLGLLGGCLRADVWELKLENSDGIHFDWCAIDSASMKEVATFLNNVKKEILALDNKEERRQMWAKYYNFCERFSIVPKGNSLIHRLQYSYALTVHQSQGSTFKKVFVNGVNLFGCQDVKMRNQLLYTGFTRAKDELHVLMKF